MPAPPEFVVRACSVLSGGPDALLTPELLRRAKRDEVSEDSEDEERCIVCTCLARHLKATATTSLSISVAEITEALRGGGYAHSHNWDDGPRARLLALAWVAIQRQVWRCVATEEHLFKLGETSLATIASDLESDVMRASFMATPAQGVVSAASSSSSGGGGTTRSKVQVGPGMGSKADMTLDMGSNTPFANHAWGADAGATHDDAVTQYGRIQHKLRLLKDLEKRRTKLLADIASETLRRWEAAKIHSSQSQGSMGAIRDLRAAVSVAALSKTTQGGDGEADPATVLDAERRLVARLEAQLQHDHKMESEFWSWVASGAQYLPQRHAPLCGDEDDGSTIELTTDLAVALVPAVAGMDALVHDLVTTGRVDSALASAAMDDVDGQLSEAGVPMHTLIERIKAASHLSLPDGDFAGNVLERGLKQCLRNPTSPDCDAALADLRAKNKNVLERALGACQASIPFAVASTTGGTSTRK